MVDSWNEELEFEALMSEGGDDGARIDLQPGDEVMGKVLHIGGGGIQLDIDGIDGLLDASHANIEDMPAVGDTVRCYVVRIRGRLVEVSSGVSKGQASKMALGTAHQTGMPVQGTVSETNKGGYVIEIGGNRAFCPHSQMDLVRVENPDELIGATLLFKVTELRDGRDATVSRRAVLLAERALQAEETREQLVVGARFRGRVTSVRDFGFFVDIGGLEGLVHVSELPYGHKRPHEVVKQGETIDVEVVRIEPATGDREMRIGLSMKALADDPFDAAIDELPPGTLLHGTVERIESYGAFVLIGAGVEGLLHISAFGRRVPTVRDVVAPGDDIIVRIKGMDATLRRVSLAYVAAEDLASVLDPATAPFANSLNARTLGSAMQTTNSDVRGEAGTAIPAERRPPPAPGTVLEVTVDKHMRFGLIVRWPESLGGPGEGMIPTMELGVSYGTELRTKFPTGTRFEAVITDIRNDGRVRLSRKQVQEDQERALATDYMKKQKKPQKSADDLGSFGALLKEKLGL